MRELVPMQPGDLPSGGEIIRGGYRGGQTPQPGGQPPPPNQPPVDSEPPPPIQGPVTPPPESSLPEGPQTYSRPGTQAAIPFRGVRFPVMAAPPTGGMPGAGGGAPVSPTPPPRRPDEEEQTVLGILDRLQGKA